jgi:hypothetical protein
VFLGLLFDLGSDGGGARSPPRLTPGSPPREIILYE